MRNQRFLTAALGRACLKAKWVVLLLLGVASCSPYGYAEDDYYAGPVDPTEFPSTYLGTNLDAMARPYFAPQLAHVQGRSVFYYKFPYSSSTDDPLQLSLAAVPRAYVYDPQPTEPISSSRCTPPPGYQFDQVRDAYRMDEQGAIFTLLPSASEYLPIAAEVVLSGAATPCQSEKSERLALLNHPDARPSGRLLVWPIVDLGADVRVPGDERLNPLPPTAALFPQRLGFYRQRLLAYLDGGYLPVLPQGDRVKLISQRLYYPRVVSQVVNGKPTLFQGMPGQGFDVLEAARFNAGYSPLCSVSSFVPADPLHPETDARVIQADPMRLIADEHLLIFCPQVQ